jgi:nifR3 family TIM-barrel protein
MKSPKLIFEITKALVDNLKTPVSVKIRSGWSKNSINALEVAKLVQDAGASLITIHPRTKEQEFSGLSDWNLIKEVKGLLKIKVVGNGDIKTCYDAKKMFEQTNCDAIMLGRSIIGNPWLIKECKDYLEKGIEPKQISIKERVDVLIKHVKLLKEEYNEKQAALLIRPHLSKYFFGIKNRKTYIVDMMKLNSGSEIIKYLKTID